MPRVPVSRRAFLQVGASGFLGLGLPAALAARQTAERPRSVILALLTGGMSHLDTLDMKPAAPAEVRGEFQPTPTSVPGIHVCEHLPMLAARMHRWAVVRSLSHRENGHLPATHRLLTGAPMPLRRGSDLDNVLSRRDWPCYAAGLSRLRPRADGVPSGVTLPHPLVEGPLTWPGQHAGLLGPTYDPLLVTQDPSSPAFRVDQFALPPGADPGRLARRRALLEEIGPAAADPFRRQQELAFELLAAGQVRQAFRLDRVPDRVRGRYGMNPFGQSLLLARRLVAAGVPVVQANMGIVQSWDTHADNWGRLKGHLLPWLDRALAALVDDLAADGALDETLVVAVGEFGRTPRVSTLPGELLPGRDHWAAAYSGLFAGAGVQGGRVIGRTDKTGAFPVTPGYTPDDVGATVYQALGLPPDAEAQDPQGRPFRLNAGAPMNALFEGA
jgi:Protein of unknown function (DUF1501)